MEEYVGFFRWRMPRKKSTLILNGMAAKFHGLKMVFFTPEGIDMENDKVTGVTVRENELKEITVRIPRIINNSPYKHDGGVIHDYLEKHAHLMYKPFGGKMKEYRHFQKEGTLKDILIPSTRIKNIEHVRRFLEDNNKAVFKPLYGDKGKRIFSLELSDHDYIFEDGIKSYKISDFKEFYRDNIRKKRLLMTKYIHSKTSKEHPFDIRITSEKNNKGKWIVSQQYARIGLNDSLTSNLATGGATVSYGKFVKGEYGKEMRTYINEQRKRIIRHLPAVVEKMVDFEINSIGADLGIDSDGKVYMFEINSYPGISRVVGQSAIYRAGYMSYYLNNLVKEKVTM